jgi:Icc-related predicted phosphoesterase
MSPRIRDIATVILCLFLCGCFSSIPEDIPPPADGTFTFGGHAYRFVQGTLVQDDRDDDSIAVVGVACDLHGNGTTAASLAAQFKDAGVDVVLVCGDICDHYRDPGPDDVEMERALTPFLEAGMLVLTIPGNHEQMPVYDTVMIRMATANPNLVNMVTVPVAKLDDVAIVAMGGYHDQRFIPASGRLLGDEDYAAAVRRTTDLPVPRLLLTHGPPRSAREGGVDQVTGGSHVGDPRLNEVFEQGGFNVHVFGHIHEAGGQAETPEGDPVPPGTPAARLLLNAAPGHPWILLDGSHTPGQAMIVRMANSTVSYRIISAS